MVEKFLTTASVLDRNKIVFFLDEMQFMLSRNEKVNVTP